MRMILFWVLCGVDAKTEEFSIGQKWLGSSTSAVVSHCLEPWGESGLRVNAVMDLKSSSWWLSAPCIPLSLLSLAGRTQSTLKTATGITPTFRVS